MFYAQLINGIVSSVAETHSPIASPYMIELDSFDTSILGHHYVNGVFIDSKFAPVPFEQAKAYKIKEIRAHFETIVASVKAAAAPYEIATWETQRTEYMAWQANSATPTPYVSALAAARGLTVPELMAKIAPKVAGFATIQGTQHKLEKLVEAATTIAEVEAITW